MKTVTLLSVAHIQTYLFDRTSRLDESVGASRIVGNAFDHWTGRPETIFIGGGNAALLFDGLSSLNAIPAIREWSGRQLKAAPGLRYVVAHVEFSEGGLVEAYRKAEDKLDALSGFPPFGSIAGALPVSRTCPSSGLAAEVWDVTRLQWVSRETRAKRTAAAEVDYSVISKDLTELGTWTGDSHVAVVHADGNAVGSLFTDLREHLKGCSDELFRHRIGELSRKVRQVTQAAEESLGADVRTLKIALENEGLLRPNEDFLPFRPLVGAGDDITFVCHGRIGLTLAARYLAHFERLSLEILGSQLTACAGVLIMPSKYPFARGYRVAATLTDSAKTKRHDHGSEGSWIDFHLLLENDTGSLDDLRRHYRISDTEDLLLRPYRLGREWDRFESIHQSFRRSSDEESAEFAPEGYWPRSASKLLLETLWQGQAATKSLVERFRTRGRSLPDPGSCPVDTGWQADRTPYFDPLEVLDHHVGFDWENNRIFRDR